MNPEDELERFFKDFSQRDRKYVEGWSEYQNAIKAGRIITAIEVASVILLNQQGAKEIMAALRKHFPDL